MDPIYPDDRESGAEAVPTPPALSSKGAARRRLGLGASGVILTLASKPGMAGNTMYCGTVSGWHSASTASRSTTSGYCTGIDANSWCKRSWPSNCSYYAKFSSVFPAGRGTLYTDSSLYSVLRNTDTSSDPSNLRREFVAAYLNASIGYNTHPSVSELKAIWNNYVLNGHYMIASTGQTLSRDQLKEFLASSHSGI